MTLCFCGCGGRAVNRHHVVYEQELQRVARASERGRDRARSIFNRWREDERNLVPVARDCHSSHHARVDPLPLVALPDSVYEFAVEKLGAGPAYEYLRRRYAGEDARLESLLEEAPDGT